MKKILILICLLLILTVPVHSLELETAPVPETGAEYLPEVQRSFGQDLWYVIRTALGELMPNLRSGMGLCFSLFAAALMVGLVQNAQEQAKRAVTLCAVAAMAGMMLYSTGSLITLGADTVSELSEYSKLLLPVMTAALAAQGGVTASATLYTATALFNTLLSRLIATVLIPMVYVYIAISVANCATGEEMLKKLQSFAKWLTVFCLKTVLYVFSGYISITGVISGSTDQMKLKATKLTIAGAVPVVGGILSDASETVLVSAGILKNAAGVYGILAFLAIMIGPFLKIGVQYLILKLTGFFCGMVGNSTCQNLVDCFSTAMGLLLAMTGAVSLMGLISVVCFLRGTGL